MSAWNAVVRWGVIDAARRRQRRHRLAAVVALLAVGALVALMLLNRSGGMPAPAPRLRLSSSPSWLTGPRLGPTHLQLLVSANGGPVALVAVDSGHVRPLRQLHVPRNQGPSVTLSAWHRDALAIVTHRLCERCALTEDDFLISGGGAVHLLARRYFPAFGGTIERAQIPGTLSEWVLRRPHHGPCGLALVPSARPAVRVPCGDLGQVSSSGIVLLTHQDQVSVLIDPTTGAVLGQLSTSVSTTPIGHGFAIQGPSQGIGSLTLIDRATGRHRKLGWPSRLGFGYQLFPDPAGPFVAIEFADPAYPDYSSPRPSTTIGQAADLWLLNIHTATLTHIPGFPILEGLKVSGIAWTADGRLVIAADGGGFAQPAKRAAIGIWRPNQPTLPVGRLPALRGYDQIVPLAG